MQQDEQFMRQAIALATGNVVSSAGGPFGAVIVREGKVLATGVNQVTRTSDPTAHAEIVAIRNACRALGTFQLGGATIYSSCEPCPMCLAAILWARCDALVFGSTAADAAAAGFDDSLFYAEVCKPAERRGLPTINLLRDEALRSFEAWDLAAERIRY